jgi:amino acid adenylation domain-containing protein
MLYLLTQAVDRAAQRAPERIAVSFAGASMTYGELLARSNQLARALTTEGVKRGDRVALLLRKGLHTAVSLYGIMKAGAAYVPLDPTAPAARLDFTIRDCGIRHVVTDSKGTPMIRRLIDHGADLRCIVGVEPEDDLHVPCVSWSSVVQLSAEAPTERIMEQDLAYVLYTSGSTGVPKGVMHTHRSALSFAEVAAQTYGFTPDDRLGNHAPLHFDLSTLDFFGAAVAGASTVIIPEAHTKLPASLSRLMEDERMTVFYAVPSAMTQLLLRGALEKRDLSALRWVLFGGEPFPPKHLRRLMALVPQALFSNVYGPTETNGVTFHVVPPIPDDSDEAIPIGRLYDNVDALVVDAKDTPVGPGEPGELLIRSPSMMRGYWSRPDLDERAFAKITVFGSFDEVYHRTGDLVRQQADGVFHFLGRRDRQVKVRGYRVELDEIEAALVAHEQVEAAAVFLVDVEDGDLRIEAAVMLRPDATVDVAALIAHLRDQLPVYAVPERIAVVENFPRTSSGKVDRLALKSQAASPQDIPV